MSEIKKNIINFTFWKKCLSNKYLWLMLIVLFIATAIRIIFFIGYGMGDDLIYSGTASGIMNDGFRALNLGFGADYRIGLYLPILLFFSIFGINDLSLVLYPFLASLGSIIVVYFIGKELFGKETGVIAAILLALCPFDAVFASTLTIDIITSFFIALSFLLFLKGDACTGKKYVLYFDLSAIFLFYGFFVKIPSYFILCCLAVISFIKRKSFKRHLYFYESTVALLLLSFLADYFFTGHFLNRWQTTLTQCIQPSWDAGILLEYPIWMFKKKYGGTLPFGYYFYLIFPALIYISKTRLKKAYPIVIWFLVLFLVLEFVPLKFELPYRPSPRYDRYLHALLIPMVVILAASFYRLWEFKKTVCIAALAALLTSSVIEGYILHKTWKEPFTDIQEASKFLLTLPEKPVYSDYLFLNRFAFDSQFVPKEINETCIMEEKDFEALKEIRNGYVVAGGSRSIEVPKWSIFILNLNDNKPPQNWKLIKEIPKELTSYRNETLKIYDVSPE